MAANKFKVEVALAFPARQKLVEVWVSPGTRVREVIEQSDIFTAFDEVPQAVRDLEYGVGLFGKEIKDPDNYVLQEGDRVEIYRPLLLGPQQARVQRAQKSPRKQVGK